MSTIADFKLINKGILEELKKSAEKTIKRSFFRKTVIDNYNLYLENNAVHLNYFIESGSVLSNLLKFLQKKGFDLTNEYDKVAQEISENRKNMTLLLTFHQKQKYMDQFVPENYTLEEIMEFNKELCDDESADLAKSMLKGLKILKENMEAIPDNDFLLLLSLQ
jgi:hypothetical protein